jgi:site-specific recombinase XerD
MPSHQQQAILFKVPSTPYRVAIPISFTTTSHQEPQQLTMCFGSGAKSRAAKFRSQQRKQIEIYENTQRELEEELAKQKKETKKDKSHFGIIFGNVGNAPYSPGVSL